MFTVAGVKQTASLQQSSAVSTSLSAADATPKSTAVINTSRLKQPANKSMSDRDHVEVGAHNYYWCIHGDIPRCISIPESPFWNLQALSSCLIIIIKRFTM